MARDSGRSVRKKWVNRLLGLGGRDSVWVGWVDRLLDRSVEREEVAWEGNVVACERHCARVDDVLEGW